MVYAVGSGSPILPPDNHGTDIQTIKDWENQLKQLAQIRGLNCYPYVESIIGELDKYTSGQKGFLSLSQVTDYIKQTFFDPHGNQDLYFMAAPTEEDVDQHDIINKITEVFGLKAPPPTKVDQTLMRLISVAKNDTYGGLPYFNDMLAQLENMGSKGTTDQLMNWANSYVARQPPSNYYSGNTTQQEEFWHILNF